MRGGYSIQLPRRTGSQPADQSPGAARPVFRHPEMTIWSAEPTIALGKHGCIIGHLFTRELPSRRIRAVDGDMLARILRSGGRSLLSECWGGYVAAFVEPDGAVSILRDPSGAVPCYFRRENDAVRVADDIRELAGRDATSVNPDELVRYLASPDAPGRSTGVFGIEQLIAGERLSLAGAQLAIESCWSPWDFVTPLEYRSPAELSDSLREVALDCLARWADTYDDILLGVSGGLDSSIVAAGVRARKELNCLTLVGPDADGDERRHARTLTDALKLPLLEAHYDLADIDVSRPPAPHHPWPNALFFRQGTEAIHRRYAECHPIGAHFSGNGGDAIFCNMRSALPFVDRFLVEGPRVSLGATLRDLCDLTGADGRLVLREAWRRYRRLSEPRAPKFNGLGLQADRLSRIAATGFRHPWLLDVPAGALPGKAAHVAFLARAHRSLELYPRREAPPHVAPLLSQPIVELSLSIPTWAWIAGGRNRSVARAAFEGLLPDQILRRSHKGGPGGFCQAIYERHGAAIRRRLRDGWLVRAGILDPDILDGTEDLGWRGIERSDRILSLAAAEGWAAWWSAT